MNLSQEEFKLLSGFIHQASGIAIGDDKAYLVRQRLGPFLESEKLNSFRELYEKLQRVEHFLLKDKVIMAMTTHETSFFRDGHPFVSFSEGILPALQEKIKRRKGQFPARRGPKVDIWCAACSTGQEPYTLAILINEFVRKFWFSGIRNEDFRILATDLSTQVLVQAVEGRYNSVEINRGLPQELRERYFSKSDDQWYISEKIRNMVTFQRLNLKDPFTMIGSFDVIFCRNVLIYFDQATTNKILNQFHEILVKDGFVVLGASENMLIDKTRFQSEKFGNSTVHRPVTSV